MILIVESGSTKSDWVLLDRVNILNSFQKKGWNKCYPMHKKTNKHTN